MIPEGDYGPHVFRARNATEVFWPVMDKIRLQGEPSSPRGQTTLELLHAVTRLDCPQERVLTISGRNLNPFFALAESLWLMTGRSDADFISYFNRRLLGLLDAKPLAEPSALGCSSPDGGLHFHGAYGERLRRSGVLTKTGARMYGPLDQLLSCYTALREDPESRQAVMTLWNPAWDNPSVRTADRPCNIAVTFKLRSKRLHMTVMNRSNDALYGLTSTNFVQFSTIQEQLAAWLGVGTGAEVHFSDSLHLYLADPFTGEPNRYAQGFPDREKFALYDFVKPTPMTRMNPAVSTQELMTVAHFLMGLIRRQSSEAPLARLRFHDELAAALAGERPKVSCAYWSGVVQACFLFIAHRSGDSEQVRDALSGFLLNDWAVECTRFLYGKHEGLLEALSTALGVPVSDLGPGTALGNYVRGERGL